MNKILLVDDDALVLEVFRRKFSQEGFEVETAPDGVAAIRSLHSARPDLVVLDLMMPKLSGVEVLKFIRNEPGLRDTPVLLLTNYFMGEMVDTATALGVQGSILKTKCNPSELIKTVKDILTGKISLEQRAPSDNKPLRGDFSTRAPQVMAELRALCQAFARAPELDRAGKLAALYSKARFVTALAGIAHHQMLSLIAGALEALLYELQNKPSAISASIVRTVVAAVDLLGVLVERAQETIAEHPVAVPVLAVDDDPIANRITVDALRRARLTCSAVEEPALALKMLAETRYALVLLDIEMPGLSGFDTCKQLRQLPGYSKTPVIYVTSHNDFESRARGVLSGADDLISKPVFPMELAVKVVTHLLRSRLSAAPAKK